MNDIQAMRKASCLERYNNMLNTLKTLKAEGSSGSASIIFHECTGFLCAMMYADIITLSEYKEMDQALFHTMYDKVGGIE